MIVKEDIVTPPPNFHSIRFWEPSLSPHKHYFFQKICELRPQLKVECYAATGLAAGRAELGWEITGKASYRININPTSEDISDAFHSSNSGTLNVFSGIRWIPMLTQAIERAQNSDGKIAIMSEPRVFTGLSGKLRLLHSRVTERGLSRRVSYVFAIGRHGPRWFQMAGYPRAKIKSFAYFIPPGQNTPPAANINCNEAVDDTFTSSTENNKIKIIYVGRLVKMKGVDILIKALANNLLRGRFKLTLVGIGEEEASLRLLAASLSVDVEYVGVLPNSKIIDVIAAHDLLALPSRSMDDGWGVVVSEALLCGTPVVVSNMVGSSVAIKDTTYGFCFESGSVEDLASKIKLIANDIRSYRNNRCRLARNAYEELSDVAGAKRFLKIIEGQQYTLK